MLRKIRYKFLAILTLNLVLFAIVIASVVFFGIRKMGVSYATERTRLAAKVVDRHLGKEDFLGTSQEAKEELEEYLDSVAKDYELERIWLIPLRTEDTKDLVLNEFMLEALSEQVEIVQIQEGIQIFSIYRYRPFLSMGETLGLIAVEFNAFDFRQQWLMVGLAVIVIIFFSLGLAAFILRKMVAPYIKFYRDLRQITLEAEQGNFKNRIQTTLQDEVQDIASWINKTHAKIYQTIRNIEERIPILMYYQQELYGQNPLNRIEKVVDELVDVYDFRRKIEGFEHFSELEESIVNLFLKMGLKDFIIVENVRSKERLIAPNNNPLEQRRYYQIINYSHLYSQDSLLSKEEQSLDEFYTMQFQNTIGFLLIFNISPLTKWNLLFMFPDEEGLESFKNILPLICNYLNVIRITLQSRYLTNMLKENLQKDPLTQLNNRAFLEEFSKNITFQASRIAIDYGVLMVDIDFFKKVNDSYGHNIGDKVLVGLADVFKEVIRKSDLAVRYGGEEFLLLLLSCSKEGALNVAQKIKEHFEKTTFESDLGEEFSCTLSVGISLFPSQAKSVKLAIKYADIALYQAKEQGRNRIICFEEEMIPKDFDPTKV